MPHPSAHCPAVALETPFTPLLCVNARRMSAASKRASHACLECAGRKVRCIRMEGASRCVECVKQHFDCTPRTHVPAKPCETCRLTHRGCDWRGHGPCTHCARMSVPCSFESLSPDGQRSSPATDSTASGSEGKPSPPPARARAGERAKRVLPGRAPQLLAGRVWKSVVAVCGPPNRGGGGLEGALRIGLWDPVYTLCTRRTFS
ncbi:hypothetical protein OH77DRAFT_1396 [Trametes cingulata]|nr:hypothetical protein OH77DRAFT_1396 [Trametes cingulata]